MKTTMRHALALLSEGFAVVAVPAVLVCCTLLGIDQTALLSMAVVAGALLLFFAGYETSKPRLRDIMPVVVLAALGAAGRILFAPFPSFKPVSAIAIIGGVVFGRRSGFMVGALAALASNFFFGQGAWTPWQMYAWGMVGYGAGLLASVNMPGRKGVAAISCMPWLVYAYGFFSGFGYGFILNLWSIVGFFHAQTLAQIAAIYLAALPFDATHAVATAAFLLVLYAPWRRKLARVQRKYGLTEQGR